MTNNIKKPFPFKKIIFLSCFSFFSLTFSIFLSFSKYVTILTFSTLLFLWGLFITYLMGRALYLYSTDFSFGIESEEKIFENEEEFIINKINNFFKINNMKLIKDSLLNLSLNDLEILYNTTNYLHEYSKFLYDNKSNLSISNFSLYDFNLNKLKKDFFDYVGNNLNKELDVNYFKLINNSLVGNTIKINKILSLDKTLNNKSKIRKINILQDGILSEGVMAGAIISENNECLSVPNNVGMSESCSSDIGGSCSSDMGGF